MAEVEYALQLARYHKPVCDRTKDTERKLVLHTIPHQRLIPQVLEGVLVPPGFVGPGNLDVREQLRWCVIGDQRDPFQAHEEPRLCTRCESSGAPAARRCT